jgi:hypothetical protein
MRKLYIVILVSSFILFNLSASAQSVIDPTDTIVNYNSSAPPTQPAWGQIGKWVRTPRLSWNTSEYKAYIYKGCAFRIHFPKSYNATANDGKKYPMLVFFHGLGETGTIYDNEYQLYHGGDVFQAAVDNGQFDGYVIFMQSQGFWGPGQYQYYTEIIDYMVANNKLDPFAISADGLSAGGQGTWEMMLDHPNYIAADLPISNVDIGYKDTSIVNLVKYTPIWDFQGGLDGAPAPSTAQQVRDAMLAGGGDYTYTEYPTLGHDAWDQAWTEPDFYPFMLRAYCSNPWTLYGRTAFCPGDAINVTIGLSRSFDAYQWRMNGTLIPGASTNTIQATQAATYDARVERNGIWSDWSRIPVQITIKAPTVTPPIQVAGAMSTAIPAADGNNYVNLQVPNNYVSYTWKKVGADTTTIGTQSILKVTQPGYYIVKVTEQYGCSSNYSPAFKVINAKGPNAPSAVASLVANTLSNTKIQLTWAANPHPVNAPIAFEIYRGTVSGGPYTFVRQVSPDSLSSTDSNLAPNVKYFYTVRAIDSTAAAALSNEANATTLSDKTPPTAPNNLAVVYTTPNAISISWSPSTDNVGVDHYVIYVNGVQTNITKQTSFIINGLTTGQAYVIYVKAVDGSNNFSAPSNQLTAAAILGGLHYSFYTTPTQWNVLPDFSTLTPVATGVSGNTDISVATQTTNFGFLWQGFIRIPVNGTYTIETSSDDGSALWFNSYTPTGTPLVNNDGLHGTQAAGGTITLQAGIYPICIEYFQGAGGYSMSLSWSCTQLYGNSNQNPITNNYFVDTYTPAGSVPAQPTLVKASAKAYNRIAVTWQDNSTTETGFEVYRATSITGTFNIVSTTAKNVTSFTDTSSLSPATTYYYKVQAINNYGNSGFDPLSTSGIGYAYYQGTFNNLAGLNTSTPVTTGTLTNVSISPALSTTYFGFKFSGSIHIPVSGQYTFSTTSDDGSDLYVGGFDSAHLVVENDFFQGATQRTGTVTLNAGNYPFYTTYFQGNGGYSLAVGWQGPGFAASTIPDSAFYNLQASATTLGLPNLPVAPTTLKATALSSSQIKLTWTDTDKTITNYQIFRSVSDTLHYKLLATIPASPLSYTDTTLFGNVTYYYHVSAINAGGANQNILAKSATTKDNSPVIVKLGTQYARYTVVTNLPLSATDVDGDKLSFTVKNKPAFTSIVDSGNGHATFVVTNPAKAKAGTYPNIIVTVNDGNGGTDTTNFTLIVNGIIKPALDSIPNYTLNANDTLTLNLNAHDQNAGDVLNWTVTGLPSSFTLTPAANYTAKLFLHPSYAAAGVYNVSVNVNDGNGGTVARQFTLTVNYKNPNTNVYVRFLNQDSIGAPWNNVTGVTSTNFVDASGAPTTIGLAMQTTWFSVFNSGPTTGNNSGIYPDAVLKDYYYFAIFGGPTSLTSKITGLDTSRSYNLNFYAGSSWPGASDNGTTTFTIGSQTDSLYVQNNTTKTAAFNSVKPASDGTITFTMGVTAGTPVGYINAFTINSLYDDGTAPVAPTALTAQNVSGKGVLLSWADHAYNETAYQVYRSANAAGPFSMIGQAAANAVSYSDTTVSGTTQYYYEVNATNTHGTSAFSNIAGILTSDKIPQIAAISNIILTNTQQVSVNVSAKDDATDHITLTASNLPSFVTFTDNGNGTGVIKVVPTAGTTGTYQNITITATDNSDSSSSASFSVSVIDPNVKSVYLSFSDGSLATPAPWNRLAGWPFAGTIFNNLLDDSNNPANLTVTFTNGFQGVVASGMQPQAGVGIYPPAVMRTGEFEGNTTTDSIKISGLSTTLKYNFVFFNSHNDGLNGTTNFTINNSTVTLNATYNINNTVSINGISADANGNVIIKVAKASGADYAYISALVIQSYNSSLNLLSPTNLQVVNTTRTTISLNWQDRAYAETGFQLYRATSSTGSYSLLASLPANTTSYTDANLTANTTYYYAVKAMNGSTGSVYSNTATGTTLAYALYINYTTNDDAPAPWFNVNAIPQLGYTWSNIFDETGAATSTGMQVTSQWAGMYTAGMNPLNGTGVYPDTVLIDSYGLFPGQTGTIQITGLNLGMKYNFTFFGSSQAYGDVNVAYTIGNQTTILDASLNTKGTATLYNIVPDNNGNANISVYAASTTSQFGLLGAMVVQGFTAPGATAPVPQQLMNAMPKDDKKKDNTPVAAAPKAENAVAAAGITAYPNPFTKYFILTVPAKGDNEKVVVNIYTINGKLIYSNSFEGLHTGINTINIETGSQINNGLYVVEVKNATTKSYQTIKIEKQ